MNKFDELFKKLNESKIAQQYYDWDENIPEDIWNEYFDNESVVILKRGLDVDTLRWYETSITVIKIYDQFLGIRHVSNIFSEYMGYDDCGYDLSFYKMEEVLLPTYEIVQE